METVETWLHDKKPPLCKRNEELARLQVMLQPAESSPSSTNQSIDDNDLERDGNSDSSGDKTETNDSNASSDGESKDESVPDAFAHKKETHTQQLHQRSPATPSILYR